MRERAFNSSLKYNFVGLPQWLAAKDAMQGAQFYLWVEKIPWRRKWQPTPVFLPGKYHGQRSLVGYSPQGYKQEDATEHETITYTF